MDIRGTRSVFLANQVLDPRILVKVVPPHGVRCFTKDLGPSAIVAITTCKQPTSTTQVPSFGKPSGTTIQGPRSADHLQGLLCPMHSVESQEHGPALPIPGPSVSDHGPLVLAL